MLMFFGLTQIHWPRIEPPDRDLRASGTSNPRRFG
jgi:hypothetical protein